MENNRRWTLPGANHITTALCIVGDVEHCSHQPGNPVPQLQAQLAGISRPCVLESLFPEVRALAYLSAAGASPQRADWLAARVLVFALDHLALAHDELSLMDAVNQRLARLSRKLAHECQSVRSFALCCGMRPLRTEGNSAQLFAAQGSPVAQSLALRSQLAAHLQLLRQRLAIAGC